MSIVKEFPAEFISNALQGPDWLTAISKNAATAFEQLPVPTRKTESWKYSSRRIDLAACQSTASKSEIDNAYLVTGYRAIFNDGVLDTGLSKLPSEGIEFIPFADLTDEDIATVTAKLEERINDPQHPFVSLNTAQFSDGLLIKVAKKAQLESPVSLVFNATGEATTFSPRIIIQAAEQSESTFIEEYTGAENASSLVSAVTQISLDRQAQLTHIRLNMEPDSLQHVGFTSVTCQRNALFKSHCVGFGGQLRRHDLLVKLQEEGANCILDGVCITQGKQHFDNHTTIEHVAPHCDSEETYRCMAADESQAIFNGRILIHRDAQKSLANMSNKNLLLSTGAEIDTKPELEIYADDVKCAHGVTIGQLDKEALFYLVSRGISKQQAASMLSMGFINEVVQRMPVQALQDIVLERITQFLNDTFSEMSS